MIAGSSATPIMTDWVTLREDNLILIQRAVSSGMRSCRGNSATNLGAA